MSKKFVVKPLGEGQMLQAFPLVQNAVPHLTMDEWLDYARSMQDKSPAADSKTGVMSAQNSDGYIYGIYCHEVRNDIQRGRILKISNLVAANLYDAAGIMDRMIDSMLSIAREQDCAAVQVDLPDAVSPGPRAVDGTVGMLKGAGYELEGVAMCRPLDKK